MSMKWINEIKKVGFKDWFWFVFRLGRCEFHPSLNPNYQHTMTYDQVKKLMEARDRAHNIDLKLSEIK